ncbi:acyl-CoA dehydrogenase family protein [Actinomarinicola tropica]|uniref:Acyl-CoA dehydrogenase n=1 Tax=Actinomarinicola tropica TaxID=2789776 RepID=A0A5Q2RLD5_9ACTN|nr:acyl-CoA dehydrogenase family protein [Actinomarinicola tropica]QGG94877.1 acyl-CoA dehydrogenase [Actinomarinicola tropica]
MTTSEYATRTNDEIREAVVGWLRQHLPADWVSGIEKDDEELYQRGRAELDERAFLKAIGEAGWAMPEWEVEYSGAGLSPEQAAVVEEVKDDYRVPRSFNILGFGLAAPTLRQWATEEQKRFFLSGMAQGDWWCQLFSEPGNGSDIAGLAMRAERDGDEWIVNGQKVWTSGAHMSKWGMLIARTNPDQPKHKGISYFILDMEAPGVEIRPLVQITGDAEFNEVFLSDVRIPDAWRIGPEGEGWAVAQTTLLNERVALSGAFGGAAARRRRRASSGASATSADGKRREVGAGMTSGGTVIDALIREAKADGRWESDPVLRDRIIDLYITGKVSAWNIQRAAAQRKAGQPGPEGSIAKLFGTEFNMAAQILSADMMTGPMAWEKDDAASAMRARAFLRSRGNSIEGGTSEIQRNIIGDRVLGLPREPDAFKGMPWKDVPRN